MSLITRTEASLVAAIMISTQETTPGHTDSSTTLIWSIRSYPNTLEFGLAVFSLTGPSNSIDASQPCHEEP